MKPNRQIYLFHYYYLFQWWNSWLNQCGNEIKPILNEIQNRNLNWILIGLITAIDWTASFIGWCEFRVEFVSIAGLFNWIRIEDIQSNSLNWNQPALNQPGMANAPKFYSSNQFTTSSLFIIEVLSLFDSFNYCYNIYFRLIHSANETKLKSMKWN